MYHISVPVIPRKLSRSDLNTVLKKLEMLDAKRVFLGVGTYTTDTDERKNAKELAKKYCSFFKEHGYEVGIWLWTFWVDGECSFTKMKTNNGTENDEFYCPSDDDFCEFAAGYIREFAECEPDLIQFDDDFRYGHLGDGFCCLCENHLRWISEKLGENVTEELLREKLTRGGENKYRMAWLEANGYFMEKFAKRMREAVDSVNPEIRLGRCACMTAWDMDGTDPVTIGRLLAGGTKPFIRLIGAPYWAVNKSWGNRIQDVIELERMEASWMADSGFEVYSEGDAWPRPRWNCPAAFLEGFDTALRADGSTDGILKYGIDYTGSAEYEWGYAERHVRNRGLYRELEDGFADKTAVGVRVYEAPKKYATTVIPKKIEGTHEIQDCFFSIAARVLAENAIPTVWHGDGICGMCFGENARYLPDGALKNGLILDACAAKILKEKGIDVGIEEIVCEESINEEYHVDEDEYTSTVFPVAAYRMKLSDSATVKSEFLLKDERIPASYTYENEAGQRFYVYTCDAYWNQETIWRNHSIGPQLADAIEWLAGRALPARCHKNPDLYMMCKAKDKELSVGLWNFCIDSILKPEITLDREYGDIRFINCKGEMTGNRVVLEEMPPFGFAGICVK